jgi:hypothetical protein
VRAFVAGGTQVATFRLRNGSLHATVRQRDGHLVVEI